MSKTPMYAPKAGSPETTLSAGINAVTTSIPVADASVFPPAPNIMTIFSGAAFETILYPTDAVANVFSGVTRGFEGAARAWNTGDTAARMIAAYDMSAAKSNIDEIYSVRPFLFGDTTLDFSTSGQVKNTISDVRISASSKAFLTLVSRDSTIESCIEVLIKDIRTSYRCLNGSIEIYGFDPTWRKMSGNTHKVAFVLFGEA